MDLFRTDEKTSRDIMDESNPSMALQEAIFESLRMPSGIEESASVNSPSPESESTSYYSPVLPDIFDTFASSRVPSNVKELQSQLKAAQDDCFTLKLKLHFLEEDYKNKFGGEKLTKENVKLKVELVKLKELLAKKDHLLQSALVVLQKSESTETLGKSEWAIEREEMEKRQKELEMVWQQRVAELERRLGLASDSGEPTSVSSTQSQSSAGPSSSNRTVSTSKAESLTSIERENSEQLVQTLKDNLKRLTQQMKELKKTHSVTMKGKDKELNSLHSAVSEKDKQVQDLLLERNRLLEDTHQKIAELMSLCTTKDEDIARLKSLSRTAEVPDQDRNNNLNNNNDNQNHSNEGVTQLLSEIKVLKQELEQTKQEKARVVEEAEIMDQQQQELSEQIERLNQDLHTLRREKMEITAQLAAAEQKGKQAGSCSCSSGASSGGPSGKSPRRQDELAKIKEERSKEQRKLMEELKRLRKESADKERRLQATLQELKALKGKNRQTYEEEARTKLTTMESSIKPLYEPKQRRPSSSCTGGEQDLQSSMVDKQRSGIPSPGPDRKPKDLIDLSGNLSFLHSQQLLSQDLKTMTMEQMRDRLLHTEALCWSMQSHLEDMAEFFQALLGNGDLKRFEKTLTPKEVHKLKSLVDRTLHISLTFGNHTNASQDELLLELISSSVQESEPENQSRDRDLSVVSVTSHVRSFRELASCSETDSVAILSSGSSEEQSGRVRRSRLSSTTEQSQLTPSLIQGLLEVLRRTERSSQKLCTQLETFGQSHLFKLLVDEILDKLKQENLLQGATPGREWEEVAQELQSFQRKSQEVIQAASLAKGCLKDGLAHLSRTSVSVSSSFQQGQSAESLFVPVSTSGSKDSTSGSWTSVPVDRAWAETLVDAHYHLSQILQEQSHQLQTMSSQSHCLLGAGDWNQLSKDLLDLWPSRTPRKDSSSWYKDGLMVLPKALPMLQQVVRCMFSALTESLHDCESTIQESAQRLKLMEVSQESRLKEIRQIQDWNLRLQMEQKSKESLLQLMKVKEVEQAKQIERLSLGFQKAKAGEGTNEQLDSALLDMREFKSKEAQLMDKIKSQSWEIERFTVELESEKASVEELSVRLEAALMSLETLQEREKKITDKMHRTEKSRSELEVCAQNLKAEVERLTAEKYELESSCKLKIEALTLNLSGQVKEALSKVVAYESKEKEMKEEVRSKRLEIEKLAAELKSGRKSVQKSHNQSSHDSQESGDVEMMDKLKDKNFEIDRLTLEVKTARESVQKLRSELDVALEKLGVAEGQQRTFSMMMEKTVQAKSDMEISAQALRSEVEKQTAEKYEADLKNSKYQLEVATTKWKNLEKCNSEMQQELTKLQTKHKDAQAEWMRKVDHEQQEQLQLEKELEQTRKTIESQNKECSEAAMKVKRLNQQLESARHNLEASENDNKSRLAEVQQLKARMKLLETELLSLKQRVKDSEQVMDGNPNNAGENVTEELERTRAELEAGRKEILRLSAQCEKFEQELSELSSQKEAVISELFPTTSELTRVTTECLKLQQKLDDVEKQKDVQLSQAEVRWKEKITALEEDAARLQKDVQEAHQVNQELRIQVSEYEERLRAISQKSPHDVIHNHPSLSAVSVDSAEQMPTDSASNTVRDETCRTNDLLGEMRELKKEVVLNNHSSARLCRELQQHSRPCHRQHCPLGKSSSSSSNSPQKKKSQQKVAANRSQSSSPDSEKAQAQRRQLLEGINGGMSSGTGSAETLTLLTASSEASFSSYPATSNEDLRTGAYPLPIPSSLPKRIPSGHADVTLPFSMPDPKTNSPPFAASDDRWKRRSTSPGHCSQSSSDSSLLHMRVRRQLGDSEKRPPKFPSKLPNQDHAGNGPSPIFQYEGPHVVMLAQTSGPALGLGDGDCDSRELQRSHYSSPDLGIESDPNMVSCRSSSTSSTDSHPAARTRMQMKGILIAGKVVQKEEQSQVANVGTQSLVHHDCASEQLLEPIADTQNNIFMGSRNQSCDNPGMALHGLCALRDLELLRQELEEALVTLQGTRATVRSRLNSKKISSPAKSLEYSTLKEVDLRCLQLSEYLVRCKKLLDTFRTLPVAPTQSWPSLPEGCLQLIDMNKLSPIASSESFRREESRRSLEESENLKDQVLNLQNKLRNMEERYQKAVEIIKANKNKSKLVHRALEKQLSATTKVIKMAKGNLKQNTDVVTLQQSEATKNKCS